MSRKAAMDGWADPSNLLAPRLLLALSGLLLCLAIAWAGAFLLREWLSGILLKHGAGPQPGDRLQVGRHGGVVRDLGWRQVTLRTASGELVRIPNHYLVHRPYAIAPCGTDPADQQDTGVLQPPAPRAASAEPQAPEADLPPVDGTRTLTELQQAHAATLAAIAALADSAGTTVQDGPAGLAASRQRQQMLIRRLTRIETLIAERRRADG